MSSHLSPRQVGRLIRVERIRRGFTHATLAGAAGLSPAYVSQIERGHRPPLGVLRIVGDVIGQRPKLDRSIGARLRAERLRAGLGIWQIEKSMAADHAWLHVLERGIRAPFPGEVFRYLRAVMGKRPILMKRLGGLDVIEAEDRLQDIGRQLVACEKMLARYQDAGLEPPDSLILERVGLRDGAALYATLVQKTAQRKKAIRGRVLKAKRGGWYWRNRFKVGEANRKRVRTMIQSGLLDRPRMQSA